MLGTKLGFSGRVVHALNHWTISLTLFHRVFFKKIAFIYLVCVFGCTNATAHRWRSRQLKFRLSPSMISGTEFSLTRWYLYPPSHLVCPLFYFDFVFLKLGLSVALELAMYQAVSNSQGFISLCPLNAEFKGVHHFAQMFCFLRQGFAVWPQVKLSLEISVPCPSNANIIRVRYLGLLFQGIWIRFPASTGQLTAMCIFSSRRSDILFWPPQASGTQIVHRHTSRQKHLHT